MPNPQIVFNGAQIILPGAYSKIDASELVPSSQGLATVLSIIGDATGGTPGVPYFFRSGDQAKSILRSGPLLDAIRFAYDPSNDGIQGGADLIVAIRANPATQSTLALAANAGTGITLTSRDYGAWTTGIQAKVEAGSVSGKKITIQYIDASLGTITEVYDNQANIAALVTAINSGIANGQAASQFVTAVAGVGTDPITNVAFTPLAGGVEGTTTSTHYTNALLKLELEDVDIVVPVTNDATIHALVNAHCAALSNTKGRKERIGIVGSLPASGFGTTDLYVTDLVTKAVAMNSDRMMLVAPGIKRPNASGVLTSYGAEYLAALVAGLACAQELGQTPTGKFVKIVGLDAAFTNPQLETLLLGGVAPVEFVRNEGFKVTQAITTWQTNANPIYREFSVRRVGDAIMKDLRLTLNRTFTGARGDATTVQSMLSTVVSRLQRFQSDKVITAFKSVAVTVTNSVARVSFEFAPSEPINYILITGTAKPGSLQASFSGQASYSGTVAS
jgi:hypothetical protein